MSSLPKTVTRQRHDCDLNPGPSAPESSTLTTRLPSHPRVKYSVAIQISGECVCGVKRCLCVTVQHVAMTSSSAATRDAVYPHDGSATD